MYMGNILGCCKFCRCCENEDTPILNLDGWNQGRTNNGELTYKPIYDDDDVV